MIFKPELVRAIQQGRKSMTRRPVKPGEKHCRYRKGHVYSIQKGRGQPGMLKLSIADEPQVQWIGRLSLADAKREGFRTTAEFLAYWHRLYGPPPTGGVRALERKRTELEDEGLVDSNIEVAALTASIEESMRLRSERLPLPAIPCQAWVIPFEVGDTRDRLNLLRAGSPGPLICTGTNRATGKPCGRGIPDGPSGEPLSHCPACGKRTGMADESDHGYTDRPREAMNAEPEAVPIAEQAAISKRARDAEATGATTAGHDHIERLATDAGELRTAARALPANRELARELARAEKALARARGFLSAAA